MKQRIISLILVGIVFCACSNYNDIDESSILAEDVETIIEQNDADKYYSFAKDDEIIVVNSDDIIRQAKFDKYHLVIEKLRAKKQ